MRILSSTLTSAQQSGSVVPAVKVTARKHVGGALRLDWERLYSGTEPGGPHAVAIPSDGSLIKARVSPVASGQSLLYQRVAVPGPASDFGQWVDTGKYGVLAVACCSLGSVVSLFWIDSSRKLQRLKSTDCGATWGGPELLDYTPSTAVCGLAASYKPDGSLAVFFTDQSTLYIKRYTGGTWQNAAAWNRTTGDLSGVACIYGTDWDLLVTGKDTSGDCKLWSLVYGDGGEVTAGAWSDLKEVAAAPAGEGYEYRSPFLAGIDLVRCFYVEDFSGTESYSRVFRSYAVSGSGFTDNLWREPLPFNYEGGYGLAAACHGDYAWLTGPDAVWRASLAEESCELSADVLGLKEELSETSSKLTVVLRNDDGRYGGVAKPSVLDTGCCIEFGPGCRTAAGVETGDGPAFFLASSEYLTAPGKATFIIYASGGWEVLQDWIARHQFRWNRSGSEANVKQLIEFVLARAGLRLKVVSASSAASGFCPDFTIHPGDSGAAIVQKLLSFIPDVLFFEGDCGYLVDPLPGDAPVYSYGSGHVIRESRYLSGSSGVSRVEVEGLDSDTGGPLLVNVFDWEQVAKGYGRALGLSDPNLGSVTEAVSRGDALLRKEDVHVFRGIIRTPVNCGQQLYDVVAVTDPPAGLSAAPFRVLGTTIVYDPARGEYDQKLILGNR